MKTNRVLIVHEAWTTGGFGAEVASVIADKGFDWLDAPVKRLGAMDTPMPYNDELERATIPSTDKIAETIRELMQYKEARRNARRRALSLGHDALSLITNKTLEDEMETEPLTMLLLAQVRQDRF